MNIPVRINEADKWQDAERLPIGSDAPKHSVEWANYTAATIAAREVYAHWVRTGSEDHRQSLAAWQRGERSWPWPDPTAEEQALADDAVRNLVRGHRAFARQGGLR